MSSDKPNPCPFCGGEERHDEDCIMAKREVDRLQTENDKLREQMERLVTLLRVDCDIDASWDGLRRFWSIGLTEDGCLMRDRACKAEAENAKLRELLAGAFEDMVAWQRVIACSNEWGYGRGCREQLFELRDAMRDLGVEVDFDGR